MLSSKDLLIHPGDTSHLYYMVTVDDSTPLNPAQKKTIQESIGAFLYYARNRERKLECS